MSDECGFEWEDESKGHHVCGEIGEHALHKCKVYGTLNAETVRCIAGAINKYYKIQRRDMSEDNSEVEELKQLIRDLYEALNDAEGWVEVTTDEREKALEVLRARVEEATGE